MVEEDEEEEVMVVRRSEQGGRTPPTKSLVKLIIAPLSTAWFLKLVQIGASPAFSHQFYDALATHHFGIIISDSWPAASSQTISWAAAWQHDGSSLQK